MADDIEEPLEYVAGPAVTVRVAPESGPSVTVEWRDVPPLTDVVVVAEALVNALRQKVAGGWTKLGKPFLVGEP